MAGKKFREPIIVKDIASQTDGQMGQITTGTTTEIYNCLAWISEKPLNPINRDMQDYRNRQSIEIAYNPDAPILYQYVVEWRGKNLTIENIKYNDNQTKIIIETLSK